MPLSVKVEQQKERRAVHLGHHQSKSTPVEGGDQAGSSSDDQAQGRPRQARQIDGEPWFDVPQLPERLAEGCILVALSIYYY